MSKRIKYSYFGKLILFIFIFVFMALNANAANTLLGVEVEQQNNSYNIILKTDSSVSVKQITNKDDDLTIVLNSVIPSDSVEIIYDNAKDLKNITLQKKNADNTVIWLQGKNIDNSKMVIKDITTGTIKQVNTKNPILNNFLYIADVKYFIFSILGSLFLFFLMVFSRPKTKKYNYKTFNNISKTKQVTINQLKNSALKKRYVPSINYTIKPVGAYMSTPSDFINSEYNSEEEIRKAG